MHTVLVLHFSPRTPEEDLLPSIEASTCHTPNDLSSIQFNGLIEHYVTSWSEAEWIIADCKPCILHLCVPAGYLIDGIADPGTGVTYQGVTKYFESRRRNKQDVPDGLVVHGQSNPPELSELVSRGGFSWAVTAASVVGSPTDAKSFCLYFYRRLRLSGDVKAAWDTANSAGCAPRGYLSHHADTKPRRTQNYYFSYFHEGGTILSAVTQLFVIPSRDFHSWVVMLLFTIWLSIVLYQMFSARGMRHGEQVKRFRSAGFITVHSPALLEVGKSAVLCDMSGVVLAGVIAILISVRLAQPRIMFTRVTSEDHIHLCHYKRYEPAARLRLAIEVTYTFVMLGCVYLAHRDWLEFLVPFLFLQFLAYAVRMGFFLGLLWEEVESAQLQTLLSTELVQSIHWANYICAPPPP